ncbi:hypothetical protein DL93DRAFT_1114828 [Clavulina sp. PMI_390]|nr:hypothetical protein DL93DRAFT_1114828 [Clavulina sp. PMI_390]
MAVIEEIIEPETPPNQPESSTTNDEDHKPQSTSKPAVDTEAIEPEGSQDIPERLKEILKKVEKARRDLMQGKSCPGVDPTDVHTIVEAFSAHKHMPFGYLVLSSLVGFLRETEIKSASSSSKSEDEQTATIARNFYGEIDMGMRAAPSEDEGRLETFRALLLNVVLFQVDAAVGAHLFLRDGMVEWLADIPELFPSTLENRRDIYRALVNLLSLASGHATCRAVVQARFATWLGQMSRTSESLVVKSAAAVALTKLSRGGAVDEERAMDGGVMQASATTERDSMMKEKRRLAAQDAELTQFMKGLIISESPASSTAPPKSKTSPPAAESQSEVSSAALTDAVEGLAYLSADEPSIKEALASDTSFLRALFSLIPLPQKQGNIVARPIDDAPTASSKASTPLTYGVATIICNLVVYPPRMTEEERQIDKLRKMARPSGAASSTSNSTPSASSDPEQESDADVAARGKKLIAAGVLPALAALSKAHTPDSLSGATRIVISRAYLALVEPKENRGAVLQNGGGKALGFLARAGGRPLGDGGSAEALFSPPPVSSSKPSTSSTTDETDKDKQQKEARKKARDASLARRTPADLIPIQALAKLAITTRPQLLFGPSEADLLDAVTPFHFLLLHPQASLLQRFEALMALTNLASVGAAVAERVAGDGTGAGGGGGEEIPGRVEMLMLDDNTLVRRAAVELLCNVITTEPMLVRYGGIPPPFASPSNHREETQLKEMLAVEGSPSQAVIARVHVLLGLSDVEDMKTQLAASGALATLLSISPLACKALLSIKKGPNGALAILGDIIDSSRVPADSASSSSDPAQAQDPGAVLQLAHRGIVCLTSLLSRSSLFTPSLQASLLEAIKEQHISRAVVNLIRPIMNAGGASEPGPGPRQILLSAAQCLRWCEEKGVEVKA